MDNFGVMARIAEFDKRHGGNPVLYGEWFFYANGAVREVDPLGALIPPPDDEYARLTNIVRYYQARLFKAVREFDAAKESLMMAACPDGEALDRLKKLQGVVGERNKAVEQAKQNLAQTERGKQLEANRQFDAELRQRHDEFKSKVKDIRI